MFDARKILDELQKQAQVVARDVNLDRGVSDLKSAAGKVRTRLETDPQARTIAAGAGGLLLLGLLGSKGGRNLIGGVAQTGAVAALGALAYKAWSERGKSVATGERSPETLRQDAFLIEADKDEGFALALVHAMLAASWADGVLDKQERIAIEAALIKAGADDEDRRDLLGDIPETERFEKIARAARTPNHAAELFAAAAVAAGEPDGRYAGFFERLAERLRLHPDHARAILNEANS